MEKSRLSLLIALGAAVSAVSVSSCVYAAPAPQSVHAEIEALFKRMQAAGCQFNRNSSWYSATEAQEHLSKKLAYFEERGAIKTTEDFITVAATKTSLSGKQYLVHCTGMGPTESNVWLQEQLKTVRSARTAP